MQKEKKKSGKKWRNLIIIAAAVLAAGGGYWYFFANGESKADGEAEYTASIVEVGTVSQTISGTGTLEPLEQYDIEAQVEGDILEDFIEIGMEVTEDQLLYSIDDADLDLSILKAENDLSQSLRTHTNNLEAIADLTLTSDYEGIVTELYVDPGDSVSNNEAIAEVVNSRKLITDSYFNLSDAAGISVGQSAEVYLESTGEQLTGTVTDVASGESVSDSGAIVKKVEISFTNPGALEEEAYVTVLVGPYACSAASQIEYSTSETIYSETSGDVSGIYIAEGDYITVGKTVLTLSDDDLLDDIESSQQSIEEDELTLSNTKDTLSEYEITSPITGTIVDKDYKAGDKLEDNVTTLAVVADMSKMIFEMDVDELDISTIEEGMSVRVTCDAVENEEFEGIITSVGILGSSSDGVTTYPVEVELSEYGSLLPGMNVDANIVAAESADTLLIPLTAVQRGNMVLVTEAYANEIGATIVDATEDRSALKDVDKNATVAMKTSATPEGYLYLMITIGLNDDTYVEVLSGLTEGAEVYQVTANVTVESEEEGMMMPGMMSGDGPPADGGGKPGR